MYVNSRFPEVTSKMRKRAEESLKPLESQFLRSLGFSLGEIHSFLVREDALPRKGSKRWREEDPDDSCDESIG